MESKTKLLLFGGTFDPPHRGHMALLENAIRAVSPDEVVVMPAGVPPHKTASPTPPALRLAMCECFRPLFENLVISDREVRREGKSYTIDTVRGILDERANTHIYFCVGSDMLASFTEWKDWRQLLDLVTLVVQSRQGNDGQMLETAAEELRAKGGRVVMAGGKVVPVSSSQLRGAITAGADPAVLLPPPADAIVKSNGLYGAGL